MIEGGTICPYLHETRPLSASAEPPVTFFHTRY